MSPGQRTTWQADTRVRVSNIFNIPLIDEPQEYFGLFVGQLAFVVAATSHVVVSYGETWKGAVGVNSRHTSSVLATLQLVRQMCFHLPVCMFTVFGLVTKYFKKKTLKTFLCGCDYFSSKMLAFPSPVSDVMPRNEHEAERWTPSKRVQFHEWSSFMSQKTSRRLLRRATM